MTSRKKVLILGATSGIGLGVTAEFLNRGYEVLGVGRSTQALENLQKEHPQKLHIEKFDLAQCECGAQLAEWTQKYGHFDIYFLNSGVASDKGFKRWSVEREALDVNVMGTTAFLMAAVESLGKADLLGTIAVNTSIAGLRPLRQAPIYSATKAYLIALLGALRGQLRRTMPGVCLVDIRPGFVDTQMAGGKFWLVPIPKASRQIVDAIFQEKEIVYISKRWRLIAWLLQVIPRQVFERF
jgi:short-subunit dehydrogenase